MNLKSLFVAVLLSSSPFIVAGCASNGHERSTGTVIDDSTITAKVKADLLAEDDVNSFDIKVQTFNGNVQLSGFVDSQWQIDKAVQIASAVTGVGHVTNNLIHKPH